MFKTVSPILDLLFPFDKLDKKAFNEEMVYSELISIIPEDKSLINIELKAELMAFQFCENYKSKIGNWGTYFGPLHVWNDGNGKMFESPSITQITNDIINYWEKRSIECHNPILIARYSGLIWDFSYTTTGLRPSHETCRLYIKSLIDIANGEYHLYETDTYSKLERALELAITLKDKELISSSKIALISYEKIHSIDDKPGLWGYCFDLLIGNKKVDLEIEEVLGIISELERKLLSLTTADSEHKKSDPWAAMNAANRLVNYYKSAGIQDDVKRVALIIGESFDQIIGEASAMQAVGWLEDVFKLYDRCNLKEEANKVLIRIREMGSKQSMELKRISQEFKIPQKKLDDYVNAMLSGESIDILHRIADGYIPKKEIAKEEVLKISKEAAFIYLIKHNLQDDKGRVVATIGPLESDLEGHIVRHISNNMTISSFLIRLVLDGANSRNLLNKTIVFNFLKKSPVVESDRFKIIDRLLDAYYSEDYITFVHLSIPQIEQAIRNVVELAGGIVIKPLRNGSYQLKVFDEILRDEILIDALGADLANYFKILFTDSRGWNLRNRVCHGLIESSLFNTTTADRVFHALLCLGMIIENKNEVQQNAN